MRITDLDEIEETLSPKNYVELFARENGLVVGQPFKVSVSKKLWFCFCDDYSVDLVGNDEIMRNCTNFSSILFRLLTGKIWITDYLGR